MVMVDSNLFVVVKCVCVCVCVCVRERERERQREIWRVTMYLVFVPSTAVGIYCCLELDEYGKFERKARTLPVTMDNATLISTWDQVK